MQRDWNRGRQWPKSGQNQQKRAYETAGETHDLSGNTGEYGTQMNRARRNPGERFDGWTPAGDTSGRPFSVFEEVQKELDQTHPSGRQTRRTEKYTPKENGILSDTAFLPETQNGAEQLSGAQPQWDAGGQTTAAQMDARNLAASVLAKGQAYSVEDAAAARYAMRALETAYPTLPQVMYLENHAGMDYTQYTGELLPKEVTEAYRQLGTLPGMGLNSVGDHITAVQSGLHRSFGDYYSGMAFLDDTLHHKLLGQDDYSSSDHEQADLFYSDAQQILNQTNAGYPKVTQWVHEKEQGIGSGLANIWLGNAATGGIAMPSGTWPGMEASSSGTGQAEQLLRQAGDRVVNQLEDSAYLYLDLLGNAGAAEQKALEEGATTDEALAYAMLTAAASTAVGAMFGGNPQTDQNAGMVNQLVGKVTSNPAVLDALASAPAEMFGDGLESAMEAYFDPIFQWMTYRGDAPVDWATFGALADEFLSGALQSGAEQMVGNDLQHQLETAANQTIYAYMARGGA